MEPIFSSGISFWATIPHWFCVSKHLRKIYEKKYSIKNEKYLTCTWMHALWENTSRFASVLTFTPINSFYMSVTNVSITFSYFIPSTRFYLLLFKYLIWSAFLRWNESFAIFIWCSFIIPKSKFLNSVKSNQK